MLNFLGNHCLVYNHGCFEILSVVLTISSTHCTCSMFVEEGEGGVLL